MRSPNSSRTGSARTSDPLRRRVLLHPEVFAEIKPPDVRMGDDLLRRPFRQDLAAVDDIGAIDQPKRLPHIVIGDQHADAASLEVPDEILDVADCNRVDAGEGLVEQHEGRLAAERARYLTTAS